MLFARGLIVVIMLLALSSPGRTADAGFACLNKEQRRAVIASGQVVPLSTAIQAARGRRGEVVKARLCYSPNGLVYLLTLLARDGKVTQATVDAASGRLAHQGR
jgi:uncharacterized membrane protein YkoI